MEGILIIIVLIAVFWFVSGNELIASHKAEKISQKETFDEFEKLINSSNAKILAWTFNKRASDRRDYRRKEFNRRDGIADSEYRGNGYIYIYPCAPNDEIWKDFRYNCTTITPE